MACPGCHRFTCPSRRPLQCRLSIACMSSMPWRSLWPLDVPSSLDNSSSRPPRRFLTRTCPVNGMSFTWYDLPQILLISHVRRRKGERWEGRDRGGRGGGWMTDRAERESVIWKHFVVTTDRACFMRMPRRRLGWGEERGWRPETWKNQDCCFSLKDVLSAYPSKHTQRLKGTPFFFSFFLMGQYEAAVSFYNKFRRLGIRQKLIVTTTVDKMKMYKQGLFRINATLAWR